MIKYLGSKRRLVPVLAQICGASGARTALDLFTGTTRVAQAFKAQGVHVTAVDSARYAHVFARPTSRPTPPPSTWRRCGRPSPTSTPSPGTPGYVTETFSRQARFFQPHNAARIDAVRDAIESEYAGSPLYPILLTSLIEAADRVDSTTGVQMAYVKQWAPRSARPSSCGCPSCSTGPGRAVQGDAVELAAGARARSTWRTSTRRTTSTGISPTTTCGRRWWPGMRPRPTAWPASGSTPATTRPPGVAFNSKRTMPAALAAVVRNVDCDLLVLSYNDESWLALDELEAMCREGRRRAAAGTPRWRRSPSTRPATSGRASASSTPRGARWAR